MVSFDRDSSTAETFTGHERLARSCTVALVILILVGTLMPGSTAHALLSPFPPYLHADKLGHAIGFAGLGFAFVHSRFERVRPWHIVGFAFLLAAFTETCQLFIPGRTGKVTDVLIDVAAACVGVYVGHGNPVSTRQARDPTAR